MIKAVITNQILDLIIRIEGTKNNVNALEVPLNLSNKFRKNSFAKSSYASNAIEGNPLSFNEVEALIDSYVKTRHYLKPEQEILNYLSALEFLEQELKTRKTPIDLDLILKVQAQIVKGESKDKIGLRGAMRPGFIFAVWNPDGSPFYIPPEYNEVRGLLEELITYINESDDHPLLKAAILHYQLVTIHPFEDGNGRTARILCNYLLSFYGYGFKNIGSLEEYFNYDVQEYYSSLQMGLPASYYLGRNEPPHPEIWLTYFLKVFELYTSRALLVLKGEVCNLESARRSHLSKKAQGFLDYLKRHNIGEYSPIELAKELKVSNHTITNWSLELVNNGYLEPKASQRRIRRYKVL